MWFLGNAAICVDSYGNWDRDIETLLNSRDCRPHCIVYYKAVAIISPMVQSMLNVNGSTTSSKYINEFSHLMIC